MPAGGFQSPACNGHIIHQKDVPGAGWQVAASLESGTRVARPVVFVAIVVPEHVQRKAEPIRCQGCGHGSAAADANHEIERTCFHAANGSGDLLETERDRHAKTEDMDAREYGPEAV